MDVTPALCIHMTLKGYVHYGIKCQINMCCFVSFFTELSQSMCFQHMMKYSMQNDHTTCSCQ